MDINQIKVGDVVEIEPPTTTAWSRKEKTENIGYLSQGEQYQVHKIYPDSGLIELVKPAKGWPSTLHPVSWGGVVIGARFVKVPGETVKIGADWARPLVLEIGRLIVRLLG